MGYKAREGGGKKGRVASCGMRRVNKSKDTSVIQTPRLILRPLARTSPG